MVSLGSHDGPSHVNAHVAGGLRLHHPADVTYKTAVDEKRCTDWGTSRY